MICDSDQEEYEDVNVYDDLNGHRLNIVPLAEDGERNAQTNNLGLLPWVPRRVEYSRERMAQLSTAENDE